MSLLDKLTDRSALKAGIAAMVREVRDIDPAALAAKIGAKVIGQGRVIDEISRAIARRMAARRRGKPVMSILVSGPTGTGKTELAKQLAAELFNGSMYKISCGEMGSSPDGLVSHLGTAEAYRGGDKDGALIAHLKSQPDTVILIDEIEKAITSKDAPLAKLLLNLLDEGQITSPRNNAAVDATGAVIVMTSNASQRELVEILRRYRNQPEELTRAVKDQMQQHFAPEFLARIDLVTTVDELDDEARAEILCVHCAKMAEDYGLEVIEIKVDLLLEALRMSKTLAAYGTRELIRWLDGAIGDDLAARSRESAKQIVVGFDPETAKGWARAA